MSDTIKIKRGAVATIPTGADGEPLFTTDTHALYIGYGGVNYQIGGSAAPVDAQYVTLATNATLTNERVLTGTSNQITVTDNGAGSTVVLSIPSGFPSADRSWNSHKITSLADPTSAQDAATKNYVDLAVAALAEHQEVLAATAAALTELSYTNNGGVGDVLTLAVAVILIDGQALAVNGRYLIKNQAAPAHNGIWVCNTVGTALISAVFTRATDFDQESDGIAGGLVFVQNGTVNEDTRWECSASGVITWGTTALNWSQFLGGVYTADETTLHLTGTTFSILSTYVGQTSITTLGTIATGVWQGTALATAYIANDAVTFAKLQNITGPVLVGRTTASAGDATSIAIGTGLSLSADTLTATGIASFGSPSASNIGDTAADGVAATALRSDTVHAREEIVESRYVPVASQTIITNSVCVIPDSIGMTLNTGVAITIATGGVLDLQVSTEGVIGNVNPGLNCCRLSLTQNLAITTSDVTGATSIWLEPVPGLGDRISLPDSTGNGWAYYRVNPGTVSLALGTLTIAQGYDVFAYNNSGTVTLEAAEWANASVSFTNASPTVGTWTAHGLATGQSIVFTGSVPTGVSASTQYFVTVIDANTFKLSTTLANVTAATFVNTSSTGTPTGHHSQARQTALVLTNGVYLKSGSLSRRLVGSFWTTAATTTEDSAAKRLLWNMDNRRVRNLIVHDATTSWTYSNSNWNQANSSTANQVVVMSGLGDAMMSLTASSVEDSTLTTPNAVGIGEDTVGNHDTNTVSGYIGAFSTNSIVGYCLLNKTVPIGYHVYTWLERDNESGTQTFYGTDGAGKWQMGLTGWLQS